MAVRNGRSQGRRELVAKDDPKSPAAEAYRTLRTNLQFAGLDKPLKTVLVTSAGPNEGKTTIISNLAVSLAQSGTSVILVGSDLRKPTVHHHFHVSNQVGLTNVLTGHVALEDAIQPSGVDGVRILTSGPVPPNPAELLGAQRMKEIIAQLSEMTDIVLFDAPPVIAVTDAGVLAQRVDGVLFLVSSGQTPREVAKAAKEQLDQVGARILGAVVNRLDSESGYYYYYYHHYYGDEGNLPWWRRLWPLGKGGKRRTPSRPPLPDVAVGRDE